MNILLSYYTILSYTRCVDDIECKCDDGYKGPSCSTFCPWECSGHGKCTLGIGCLCENGY